MFGVGKMAAFAGLVVLDAGHVLSGGAVFLLVGGLVAFGAVQALARAWKGERDAAVAKAERLVEDRAADVKVIDELRTKIERLEGETNVKLYADRSSEEHKAILEGMTELTHSVRANTTALEFLAKQLQLNLDLEGGTT